MRNLIQNTKKLTVLDATLIIQNEHLPEIQSHMEDCSDNLNALGTKLEQCMNSLPLGTSTIIEDTAQLEQQVGDYGAKLKQTNVLMDQDRKQNEYMADKLAELASLVQHERQALSELTTLAQKMRSDEMAQVTSTLQSNTIDQIVRERSDRMEQAALTNTFFTSD